MNPGGAGYGGHDREGPAGIVACRFTGLGSIYYLELEDGDDTPITDLYGGRFLPTDGFHASVPITAAFTNVLPTSGWGESGLSAYCCGFTQIIASTGAGLSSGGSEFFLPWNRSNYGLEDQSAIPGDAGPPILSASPGTVMNQQFTYLVFYSTFGIRGYINLYRRSGPSLLATDWIVNAP